MNVFLLFWAYEVWSSAHLTLLFADFSSGRLQYYTNKSIEVSSKIRPMIMLRLLMQKQQETVTYEELAKVFGMLNQNENQKKRFESHFGFPTVKYPEKLSTFSSSPRFSGWT